MSNEIVLAESGNRDIIRSFDDVERAGRAMAASGYFNDAKDAAQCIVKILAGREMGFGPFAAMTGIHIIQGKPAPGANLMAAAIKRHPRYDYQVHKMEDKAVEIEFFQDGQTAGTSSFTAADAQRAGTKNMGKFPRNMLFARAISNGVKWFCPDVFNGATAYVPEELGVSTPVKSLPAAAIVEGEFVEPESAAADGDLPADLWDNAPEIPPQDAAPSETTRPYSPEVLRDFIVGSAEEKRAANFTYGEKAENYRGAVRGNLELCFAGDPHSDQKRRQVSEYLTGEASSKDWGDAMIATLRKWLNAKPDEGGTWLPDPLAEKEAVTVAKAAALAAGQTEMDLA